MNIPATLALCAIALFTCQGVAAQLDSSELHDLVSDVSPDMIDIRHALHQFPELSNREFRTSAKVAEHLESLGLEVRTEVAHTGVVGILRGGQPGPVIALRADMDALPVTEETDLPYRSTVRTEYNGQEVGVMHACGHDVHTAVLLGVASTLTALSEQLAGTVIFIFQPAEEGVPEGETGGAKQMLAEGVFGDLEPEAIFALHTTTALETGKLGYVDGTAAAASDIFTATLRGQSAHAAFPELGVDPIVMGAQAVLALQTLPSRNFSAFDPVVISVTQFNAGIRYNIIPESVTFGGGVRTFNENTRTEVEQRIEEVLAGIANAAGGTSTVVYERGYPPLVNNSRLVQESLPALNRALGEENVVEAEPVMASEDFAYFANEIPAAFFSLGVVAPGTTSGPNHSPTFIADDNSIPVGITAISSLVLARLSFF